jgi:hypothetical protein
MFLPHNRKRFELLKKQKEEQEAKIEPIIEPIIEQIPEIPEMEIVKSTSSASYEDDNVSVFSNDDLISYQSNFEDLPYMIDEAELQLVNPDLSRKFLYIPKGEKPKKKTYKPKIKDT